MLVSDGIFADDALGERVIFAELFDIYSAILTEKQRTACELMLRDDLTLSEMASVLGMSRQGAHDIVRRTKAFIDETEHLLGVRRLTDAAERMAALIDGYKDELPQGFLDEAAEIQKILRRAPDV